MRKSLQIGNKIVINNSDNEAIDYANLLNDYWRIGLLKQRSSSLEKLIKEKDELIASLQETIDLLKSR